jgi:type II secretory pathway pseudopilin PulG
MTRRNRLSEKGFTLVEMMMTTALLMIVLAIVLPLVAGSLNTFTATQVRSDAVDNAQLALSQIGHDVVSSNLLYQDATGVVHLETFGTAAGSTCVEYQVAYPAAGQPQVAVLQRRIKTPGPAWPAVTGGWGSIMTGIVNSSQTATPAVLAVSSTSRSLIVNLWVQLDTRKAGLAAAPENYVSTFTGTAIPANTAAFASSTSEPC